MVSREEEIAELEIKFITELPSGSVGIISALPFSGRKEPSPITKKELEEFIEAFKNNQETFKKDVPRWL